MADPTYTCLIPYTQKDALEISAKSASADGWNVEAFLDERGAGVNKMREVLLNRAFVDERIKYVCYLDEGKVLFPHLDRVRRIFNENPDIDLVYTDKESYPCSWISKVEALKEIKRVYGYVWEYDLPSEDGEYIQKKFLQMRFKAYHLIIDKN